MLFFVFLLQTRSAPVASVSILIVNFCQSVGVCISHGVIMHGWHMVICFAFRYVPCSSLFSVTVISFVNHVLGLSSWGLRIGRGMSAVASHKSHLRESEFCFHFASHSALASFWFSSLTFDSASFAASFIRYPGLHLLQV